MRNKESIQEMLYDFPYHYLPKRKGGGYSQCQSLSWGFEYLMYVECLAAKIVSMNVDSVCDFGCGDGRLLNELASKGEAPNVMVGVDKSDRAIGFAKLFQTADTVQFSTKLDGNYEFDLITCIEVLEHIYPPQIHEFIVEMKSALKKGGSILLTVPSKTQRLNAKHYQHFDMADLEKIFADHDDLQITEKQFLVKRNKLRNLIFRIIDNKFFILRHAVFLEKVYQWYKRRFLYSSPKLSAKIFIAIKKI